MKKDFKMSKASVIKKLILSSIVLVISACSDSTTPTVNGIVADGYLEAAEVCWAKIDAPDECDGASVTTNAKGEYQLPIPEGLDAATRHIIAKVIKGVTKDTDLVTAGNPSGFVATDEVYLTPKGKRFLSPLTTEMEHELRRDPSLSIALVEGRVKARHGFDDSVSLFEDHVDKEKNGTDAEKVHYGKVHTAAKNIAKTLHASIAMTGFERPMSQGSADMSHFKAVLDGFDDIDHNHSHDLSHLKTALAGFSDKEGCVAPKEWSAEMNHCMVMDDTDMDHEDMDHDDGMDMGGVTGNAVTGRDLYVAQGCAAAGCHTNNPADGVKNIDNGQNVATIRGAIGRVAAMASFSSLTDNQLTDIAAYIKEAQCPNGGAWMVMSGVSMCM